ncbi:MAG: hypothetical protein AMJ56_06780 [Anaerolineae bacterium SG8_19]|nr:MAG: hypothetical protein AMJ56_06780 [Anaerolineae bacterium SG8_19]
MAYDEGLAQRIRETLGDRRGLVEKKMFGGVGFMLHAHARPFDFTGRPMKGWVMISPDGYASEEDLKDWVAEGVKFALSLPPK